MAGGCAAGVAAQTQSTPPARPQQTTTGSKTQTGNSATGKAQPFVISGCVGNPMGGGVNGGTGSTGSTGSTGGSTMGQPMYSLGHLDYGTHGSAYDEWVRTHPRPGASKTSGANSSTTDRPNELMLGTTRTSGVDLSKYVNQNVEITGSLAYPSGSSSMNGNRTSGTSGSGTMGSRTTGSGSTGSGTTGSGTSGSGRTGSGTTGSGTTGSGTTGSGTTGSGTTGSGTMGSGTTGSSAMGAGTNGRNGTATGQTMLHSSNAPTLNVTSVRVISPNCGGTN